MRECHDYWIQLHGGEIEAVLCIDACSELTTIQNPFLFLIL